MHQGTNTDHSGSPLDLRIPKICDSGTWTFPDPSGPVVWRLELTRGAAVLGSTDGHDFVWDCKIDHYDKTTTGAGRGDVEVRLEFAMLVEARDGDTGAFHLNASNMRQPFPDPMPEGGQRWVIAASSDSGLRFRIFRTFEVVGTPQWPGVVAAGHTPPLAHEEPRQSIDAPKKKRASHV